MRCYRIILFIALCILADFLLAHGLAALEREIPKGPVNIEADSISYDSNQDVYIAEGNVDITFAGGYLKADSVQFNKTTKDALAEGNVAIKSENDVLEGRVARFNLDTETGMVQDGRLFFFKNHLYLNGSQISKTDQATYNIKDATATTCDGERPDWRFTGKEIDVTIDGYGTLKRGTFQVKNVPILYMPYLIFPAKTTRQSGFLFPRLAYSQDKHGWDIALPLYWAISEDTDATLYSRYMDKRGFQEGLEFRYCISEDSYGTIYGDYLNDSKTVSETTQDGLPRDWQEKQERWSYYVNHQTTFSDGLYFKTDIKKVSDNWYFRDFDAYNYYLEHYQGIENKRFQKVSFVGDRSLSSLASTARLAKNWQWYNLTALGQYTDNYQNPSNDTTLQKYPEITFTGVTHPLFDSPLNFEIESVYDYYYRTEGLKGHLFDIYPILSLPLRYEDYFQFTPRIGLRETTWDSKHTDGTTPGQRGSRELYDIGAEFSTEVYRIFNVAGESVKMIRHGIRPELNYTYIPYVYQDDLADYVTAVDEANSLTYSLTNTLIARLTDANGNNRYREFFRLKLSQTYDIKEARRNTDGSTRKRRPFNPVSIECDFKPFQYLSVDSDASYDVNSGEWKETNLDLTVSDWRGDSVNAQYRYTQDTLEEINLSVQAVVSKSLDLTYVLRRNELDRKNLESTYGLNYHRQCWDIALLYSDTSDDRKYMVIVSLYGIGQVGRAEMGTENIARNF